MEARSSGRWIFFGTAAAISAGILDLTRDIASMSKLECFLLGAMAAWTPGLVVLAWLVLRAPLEKETRSGSLGEADANGSIRPADLKEVDLKVLGHSRALNEVE